VRQAEVTAAKQMLERVADRHLLWPRKLIGDTGYGSAGMLGRLDQHPPLRREGDFFNGIGTLQPFL